MMQASEQAHANTMRLNEATAEQKLRTLLHSEFMSMKADMDRKTEHERRAGAESTAGQLKEYMERFD